MDAIVEERRFLPLVAKMLTLWFPELGNRAMAASDILITKENIPTLPLALVAFNRSVANPPTRNRYEEFPIEDQFIIEFWLKPIRYPRSDNSEAPFWAFYPYEQIRDTLITNLCVRWDVPTEQCHRIHYRGMTVSADQFAVTFTFTFTATYIWKPPTSPQRGEPFEISFHLCTPESCVVDECVEVDPCA